MRSTFTFILTLATALSFAQKWDVNNPPGEYQEVQFTVNEGTWMNLDLSPDGKTLVFDLLGDIYSLPVEGGKATLLRGGLAYEVQPRFSPDGRKILFTSDAGGGDNIWYMNTDGSDAKAITQEDFRLLNNAVWAPGGEYIVARKHFTSGRSLGAGELWMYHVSGGKGVQLTKRKNDQQDLNEPCFDPTGRYVYYSEDVYPGGAFQYNKDPNSQIYVVKRYDLHTGATETVISGGGGAVRPQASPDGKYISFVKRVREKSVLFLHDLESGIEWPLYDSLSKDQQEAWAIFGVYTGYAWTPDAKSIVIWSHGKILKIDVESREVKEIPFEAEVKQKIRKAIRYRQEVAPETFTSKMIRHAVTSPDGKFLVFSAAGYLYRKALPNGTPERLTNQSDYFEFEPSFSSDSKNLLFVSWSDAETGAIMQVPVTGGKPKKISTGKGIFRNPSYSKDGKTILFWKERGNDHQGFAWTEDAGIYLMSADGKNPKQVGKVVAAPFFSKDEKWIYFERGNSLWKMNLHGFEEQKVVSSTYAKNYTLSPDNRWIAFTDLHKVYVAAFPETGKTLDLSGGSMNLPVAQFAKDAGINLHWSKDSKTLHWTLGDEYFSKALNERFLFLEGAADSLDALPLKGNPVGLVLKTAKPTETYVLNNARIITVNQLDEVIEKGYIVVQENKIVEIHSGSYDPEFSKIKGVKDIRDCKGKTIMPGMVDVHAHLWTFREGIHPQNYWPYVANLAYGVTTTHDPSSNTEMVFTQSEMVKTGSMIGPRIYSTGTILYGADGDFKAVINNYDDARSAVYRTQAFGAFSVKSYNQPRREQRQQVITAADSLGVMVYPEGGSFFYHNMSMILDGHSGVEHNIPVAPVYNDVVQLWSRSNTGYTPTLIVCYGAASGENYWYQHTNVWEKEHLLKFTPRSVVDSRARHRTMLPEAEYENGHILVSQSCKKLADAGVKVNLGSHGQLEGLGAHWELWMLAQGGMSPLQAIRCATMNGAEYIGMGDQIGSIEEGKLADLIILDENPLEDIYHT
ncbi:MAG: amidohydrolase family protein, partial [Bacteroidota bacterium]|nr:amidohydrolase family protein [Bacteroidota bacterium]MDX5431368.1 amidohydrolase family protein [Bacteroidota bacterium]MDX5470098.1 amidohydrolase family protein [Bacteroidota bacterium]